MKGRIACWNSEVRVMGRSEFRLFVRQIVVETAAVLLLIAVAVTFGGAWGALAMVIAAICFANQVEFQRQRALVSRNSSEYLEKGPAELGERPVEIALYWMGVQYATDIGHLCFIDGWLHFESYHCDFSIARRHVLGVATPIKSIYIDESLKDMPKEYAYRISYTAEEPGYALAYRYLDAWAPSLERGTADLKIWERSEVSEDGEPVFPPNIPNASSLARPAYLTRMAILYLMLNVVAMFSLESFQLQGVMYSAALFVAFLPFGHAFKSWTKAKKQFESLRFLARHDDAQTERVLFNPRRRRKRLSDTDSPSALGE